MKVYLVMRGECVLHVFRNEEDAQEYCSVLEYWVMEEKVQECSLV